MNVKNGIASSVSFCMIPYMRCGSAWNSSACSSPSSMPIPPNSNPTAASAKATG